MKQQRRVVPFSSTAADTTPSALFLSIVCRVHFYSRVQYKSFSLPDTFSFPFFFCSCRSHSVSRFGCRQFATPSCSFQSPFPLSPSLIYLCGVGEYNSFLSCDAKKRERKISRKNWTVSSFRSARLTALSFQSIRYTCSHFIAVVIVFNVILFLSPLIAETDYHLLQSHDDVRGRICCPGTATTRPLMFDREGPPARKPKPSGHADAAAHNREIMCEKCEAIRCYGGTKWSSAASDYLKLASLACYNASKRCHCLFTPSAPCYVYSVRFQRRELQRRTCLTGFFNRNLRAHADYFVLREGRAVLRKESIGQPGTADTANVVIYCYRYPSVKYEPAGPCVVVQSVSQSTSLLAQI